MALLSQSVARCSLVAHWASSPARSWAIVCLQDEMQGERKGSRLRTGRQVGAARCQSINLGASERGQSESGGLCMKLVVGGRPIVCAVYCSFCRPRRPQIHTLFGAPFGRAARHQQSSFGPPFAFPLGGEPAKLNCLLKMVTQRIIKRRFGPHTHAASKPAQRHTDTRANDKLPV